MTVSERTSRIGIVKPAAAPLRFDLTLFDHANTRVRLVATRVAQSQAGADALVGRLCSGGIAQILPSPALAKTERARQRRLRVTDELCACRHKMGGWKCGGFTYTDWRPRGACLAHGIW